VRREGAQQRHDARLDRLDDGAPQRAVELLRREHQHVIRAKHDHGDAGVVGAVLTGQRRLAGLAVGRVGPQRIEHGGDVQPVLRRQRAERERPGVLVDHPLQAGIRAQAVAPLAERVQEQPRRRVAVPDLGENRRVAAPPRALGIDGARPLRRGGDDRDRVQVDDRRPRPHQRAGVDELGLVIAVAGAVRGAEGRGGQDLVADRQAVQRQGGVEGQVRPGHPPAKALVERGAEQPGCVRAARLDLQRGLRRQLGDRRVGGIRPQPDVQRGGGPRVGGVLRGGGRSGPGGPQQQRQEQDDGMTHRRVSPLFAVWE